MGKAGRPKYDDLILSRTRLGIISALMDGDELEFTYLRDALELSDGNLSVQIRKLEQAGYVKVKKTFVERKPKTFCQITTKGRKALLDLLRHLESMVDTG